VLTIGTDIRARQRIRDLPALIKESNLKGVALVFGNEETGLSDEAKRACNILARIPGTGLVECLNIAEAATLFMQELYEM
jgi:TrmH RNA methyltransferase